LSFIIYNFSCFFKAGKVPLKLNEDTWAKFKEAVRTFNRQKNAFYKDLKKEQLTNLNNKLELIKIAETNKDNTDYEATTALMKKIQNDWKKIGHVPRKDSDKIWKQFKAACNYYFDKLNASKNAAQQDLVDAFNKKQDLLEVVKTLSLPKEQKEGLEVINSYIEQWNSIGKVPGDKRYIDVKFSKALDTLYDQLNIDRQELEMMKFENKLEELKNADDNGKGLDNETNFVRKKIDEIKGQINQLENNLQFFTNVDEKNPLVKAVYDNIICSCNSLALLAAASAKLASGEA